MATKFFTDINLNKNQLKNAAIDPLASGDPSSPNVGQIYFDTNASSSTYRRLKIYAGSSTWVSIPYSGNIVNADISSSADITVTKLLTSGTNAVTLSSIGAPTGTVSFNSQAINNITTINTSGDVTVGGDLTVNGNTTTINTTNLDVEDKNIVIANVASPDNDTADGAGITIKGASDKTFNWVKATTAFTSSENLNLASGKVYEIAGTTVLSSTAVLGKTPGGSASTDITVNNASQDLTNKTYNGLNVSTTTGTLTIASGSTLATSGANSLTFTTTDTTSVTLPSGTKTLAATDQSFYIGTTQVAINRASSSQTLNGVSIDGNAATVTNGVYTTDTGSVTNTMLAGSIDLTTKVTGQLPIANGGTGAATTSQNYVFAGPATGGSGAPSFRSLVAADISAAGAAVKYANTVTFNIASKPVTHNLGTKDVLVQLYDSTDQQVFFDVVTTDSNTVTVTNSTADGLTYRIVVIG